MEIRNTGLNIQNVISGLNKIILINSHKPNNHYEVGLLYITLIYFWKVVSSLLVLPNCLSCKSKITDCFIVLSTCYMTQTVFVILLGYYKML